ncbi:MAG: diacylglycerol kinase family lipid kinase [Muribaculaceae bacterium]|nr:diacylglycerol kinase family lipid kinase [Muribaculaceae bacterium]
MKKILLIINPIAGTGRKDDIAFLTKSRLEAAGASVDVRLTEKKGDATDFAESAVREGYYGVVAAGGDGTINETAMALCETDVVLGIIPCGSGNGLARHFGIHVDTEAAIDVISHDNIMEVDYGTVNKRPFFCTCGVGFDAAVSDRFARQNHRGMLMYIKSAIEAYLHFKPTDYVIYANGKALTERAFLVACCNTTQYGNNAYIAPKADITDGLLDVTIMHAGNIFQDAIAGIDLMSGQIDNNIKIDTFKASEIRIVRKNDGPAHIDGEPVDLTDDLNVKCHHKGLKVFTPLYIEPVMPFVTPIMSRWEEFVTSINHLLR